MKLFKRKKKYEWNGHWETDYLLKEFDPRTETIIKFKDELSDIYTPSKAQLQAVTYLLNNQLQIHNALCIKLLDQYDQWKGIYKERLPILNTIEDVKKHIHITSIYVDTPEKDKIAYVGYGGSCSWDSEHGIGFYSHAQKVFEIGKASISFCGTWNAYKDLGLEKKLEIANEKSKTEAIMPKQYTPHPIYDLKPSQEEANKAYYYRLIERGFTKKFIAHFNVGDILTETRTDYNDMSFLQKACQSDNEELVDFILSKKPVNTSGCLKSASHNLNLNILKKLINYGIDINEEDESSKDYPIENIIEALGTMIRNNASKDEFDKGIEVLIWALENKANPLHIIKHSNKHDKLEIEFKDIEIRDQIRGILIKYMHNMNKIL